MQSLIHARIFKSISIHAQDSWPFRPQHFSSPFCIDKFQIELEKTVVCFVVLLELILFSPPFCHLISS